MLVWNDKAQLRFSGLLASYFFIPTVILALVALVIPMFVPRYLVFAAVGMPFVVAVALDRLARRPEVLVLAGMIVLAAEVLGLQSVHRQKDGLNGTDLRRDFRLDVLAAKLQEAVRPGDEIVLEIFDLVLAIQLLQSDRHTTEALHSLTSQHCSRSF